MYYHCFIYFLIGLLMEFRLVACIILKGIYVHTLERTLTYVHAYIHIRTYALCMHAHE